jgi:hypothetical protein
VEVVPVADVVVVASVVVVVVPAFGDEQATTSNKSNEMSLGIEPRSYGIGGLGQ